MPVSTRPLLPTRHFLTLLVASTCLASASAQNLRLRPEGSTPAEAATTYGQREDAMRFAADMAARRGLDPAWVQQALGEARYIPDVARLIMPPPTGTAKNWAAYRARFVEPLRIRHGIAFWREHEQWLTRAQETYGVPAEVVVGIVGVETLFGRHMGNFRVMDALATLAFDFPAGRRDRSAFFRDELEQLFVLAQRANADPRSFKGSYAGAMGLGQFMPSSWNKYAIDFDGDGRVDLQSSPADVIGSIAHYLAEFGWQRGVPARFEVTIPADAAQRATLLAPDIKPTFTARQFAELGAGLPAQAHEHPGLLALVELENGDAPRSYVAGTENFYAVTRYNWSSYYAMAVLDLGEAIALVRNRVDR